MKQYHPFCQIKMPTNMHYVQIRQTYCLSKIAHIQYGTVHQWAWP